MGRDAAGGLITKRANNSDMRWRIFFFLCLSSGCGEAQAEANNSRTDEVFKNTDVSEMLADRLRLCCCVLLSGFRERDRRAQSNHLRWARKRRRRRGRGGKEGEFLLALRKAAMHAPHAEGAKRRPEEED